MPTTIVPGGAPVRVNTSSSGENALLAFSGAAGQRVSLKLTDVTVGTSSCCSLRVSIAAPDGSTLVAPTYVGTAGGFIDTKTLLQGGTYAILVDPQGTASGSATLSLYDVPPDVSASIVPGGAAVSVTTSVPGQNAGLTFYGKTGQALTIQFSGVTIPTSKVSVVGPDASTVVAPTYVFGSGKTITAVLSLAGTHKIVVDPQGGDVGSMTVTLS